MTEPSRAHSRLKRLKERSEEILEDLEGARADLLSVNDLNRVLRQVLRNQVAIMTMLGESSLSQTSPNVKVNQPGSNGVQAASPRISLRERPSAEDAQPEEQAAADLAPPEGDDLDALVEEIESLPLGEDAKVTHSLARVFVEQFDNRDKDYEKGLDKLNRWVAGDEAGTPFQWRGDRAYLNLKCASMDSVKNYEDQLMNRMGFRRRLGRLDVPGLAGEIVVYERP